MKPDSGKRLTGLNTAGKRYRESNGILSLHKSVVRLLDKSIRSGTNLCFYIPIEEFLYQVLNCYAFFARTSVHIDFFPMLIHFRLSFQFLRADATKQVVWSNQQWDTDSTINLIRACVISTSVQYKLCVILDVIYVWYVIKNKRVFYTLSTCVFNIL